MRSAVLRAFSPRTAGAGIGLAGLLCLLSVSAGCRSGTVAEQPGQESAPPISAEAPPVVNGMNMERVIGRSRGEADRLALTIRLSLFRVEVPFGKVSLSERLWRYLDEEVTDVATLSALQRNGFRVGRAKVDQWPPVARLLREMAGRALRRTDSLAWPGRPHPVVLKEHEGVRRIFTFSRAGTLHGMDCPSGDYVLMLSCHLNAEDPSEVLLQAVPLVRSSRAALRWERTDTGYERRHRPIATPIEALEFTVNVPRGHYIVVGPGVGVSRDTSPAGRFLITERRGLRYETLLVIVPEVFAAPT